MKPRKLKLESGVWRFIVRSVVTTLWTPSGKKHRIINAFISGAPEGAHVCGDERCTAAGYPVTPGNLRKYIEENLL